MCTIWVLTSFNWAISFFKNLCFSSSPLISSLRRFSLLSWSVTFLFFCQLLSLLMFSWADVEVLLREGTLFKKPSMEGLENFMAKCLLCFNPFAWEVIAAFPIPLTSIGFLHREHQPEFSSASTGRSHALKSSISHHSMLNLFLYLLELLHGMVKFTC